MKGIPIHRGMEGYSVGLFTGEVEPSMCRELDPVCIERLVASLRGRGNLLRPSTQSQTHGFLQAMSTPEWRLRTNTLRSSSSHGRSSLPEAISQPPRTDTLRKGNPVPTSASLGSRESVSWSRHCCQVVFDDLPRCFPNKRTEGPFAILKPIAVRCAKFPDANSQHERALTPRTEASLRFAVQPQTGPHDGCWIGQC
jgi:hypothetical protein